MRHTIKAIGLLAVLALISIPETGLTQTDLRPSLNQFGRVGLIDMPTAESLPDAELSFSVSYFAESFRNTLNFQVHPRISGAFRYTRLGNWTNGTETFDRSFDIKYRILDERRLRPAVAIGLRDFLGTGLYSSQYVVATKNVGSKLKVSAGLGWGRLSNSRQFQKLNFGLGGKPNYDEWFRGDMGFFGGIEWQTPIEGLRFKAEYSSDQYVPENRIVGKRTSPTFDRKTSLNFGLSYMTRRNVQISGYYMYGSEIGLSFSTSLNPKRARMLAGQRKAVRPIAIRQRSPDEPLLASFGEPSLASFDGKNRDSVASGYTQQLQKLIDEKFVLIVYSDYGANSAEVRIRNYRFTKPGQAIEHTMRAMSRVLPDNIDTFTVVLLEDSLAVSKTTMRRSDLEAIGADSTGNLEFPDFADVAPAGKRSGNGIETEGVFPRFTSFLTPSISPHLFDPDNPLRADLRLKWHNLLDIRPGLSVSSVVSVKLLGNLDDNVRGSNSVLPRVRTDLNLYQQNSELTVDRLTVDYLTKISPDVYGRFSAGIFEAMYGGVSAEALWKPTSSRLALGAEINWVKKRDFDQRFIFRDYSTVTSFVSAYWDIGNSYYGQVDVGRYLAKDLGATFTVERRFENGWRVGAFATFTDVPFSDFGEGSFDKGIKITIPYAWVAGQPSRRRHETVIRSITRDGGARVSVPNRLYEIVSGADRNRIVNSW